MEMWDAYIQLLGAVFSLALAVYTFRLSVFFKGGMLHKPFVIMVPAFLLYAFGAFVDLFALTEAGPEVLHFGHFLTFLAFFALMTYSIYLLYRAWRKIGMGKV